MTLSFLPAWLDSLVWREAEAVGGLRRDVFYDETGGHGQVAWMGLQGPPIAPYVFKHWQMGHLP